MKRILRYVSMGAAAAGLLWAGQAVAEGTSASGTPAGASSPQGSYSPKQGKDTTSRNQAPNSQSTGSSSSGMGSSYGSSSSSSRMGSSASASNEVSGKVEKFDRSSHTLKLRGSDKEFKVDPSTTDVTRDGAHASLDDLKEGEQVRASFSGTGDHVTATRIDIQGSGPAGGGSSSKYGSSPTSGSPK